MGLACEFRAWKLGILPELADGLLGRHDVDVGGKDKQDACLPRQPRRLSSERMPEARATFDLVAPESPDRVHRHTYDV